MSIHTRTTFASKSITPPTPTTLGCNGSIHTPYTGIDSPIEINGMRLHQNGMNTLFISVDTLFIPSMMVGAVIDYMAPHVQLKKEQVFIGASHTHYSPFLDHAKPHLGHVDATFMALFTTALHQLLDALFSSNGVPVDASYDDMPLKNVMIARRNQAWRFRKKCLPWKSMDIFPNQMAPIDDALRMIRYYCPNTKNVMGVVWNMACHPVMYHSPQHLSAHFIGNVRDTIRQHYGEDVPVLFFQGFSGDVRPDHCPKATRFNGRCLEWFNKGKPAFQNFGKTSYTTWVKKITNAVDGLLKRPLKPMPNASIVSKYTDVPLSDILSGESNQRVAFHAVHVSDEVVLLGVSAEVVSEYALNIQKLYPNKTIIPVGCYGHVFGYWPTQAMLNEGGYEVTGFHKGFSLQGTFKSCLERVFYGVVDDIMVGI